jgi:hypothetical protein
MVVELSKMRLIAVLHPYNFSILPSRMVPT